MKVAVAHMGARMHYAVPEIFARADALEHFFTDLRSPRALRVAAGPFSGLPLMSPLQRYLDRNPRNVPERKITAFNGLGLSYVLRLARAKTLQQQMEVHLWAGRSFCSEVIGRGLGGATHTFTYNTAGLELMRHAKERGLKIVMEQAIAPREFEMGLLSAEQDRFPGWEERQPGRPSGALKEICERERDEWGAADLILCGSQFAADALRTCRGPFNRCEVVPYGVSASLGLAPHVPKSGPLRVLTVGTVGLRKGSPYVLETAKRCADFCEFRMVGPLTSSAEALRRISQYVTLTGPVPRSDIGEHYAWADIFFLPSVCEGSATAIYEALAAGLPVLTTPNSGSVVTHGKDGWVVPAGAVEEMSVVLAQMSEDRGALEEFSIFASETSRRYDMGSYGQRLLSAMAKA